MPKVQCKMCGGELTLPENAQNGTCEYCGSRVTFPKIADEHQENLYARAEHFRQMNDYDKALRAYEQIVTASPDDAEAYWGLVLCRYGIEYVKDPATGERIPTCHRVSYDSILADADYLAALEHAGSVERSIYETEAKRIAEIQKGILAISAQEEPFDVFICYKESDDSGRRTRDSVAAQEIYYALTEQGYKVFFSRITLEKKLGQQYEPYIFAALNSAKAMLVIGSKPEYFNAVWVRNEWSRFLALMKKDRKKLLIPCYRDMDAYDIPEELSMFQAQDMGKIGFIQDLLHGISKVAKTGKAAGTPAVPAASGKNPLLVRAQLFLETGDFAKTLDFCEQVLNSEPKNGEAYFLRLMAELKLSDEAELVKADGLENNKTFKLAQRFADDALKSKLNGILKAQTEAREAERRRREEEAERRRREEEEERQWQMRTAEIEDASRKRINLIDRYLAAETTLHGNGSELYVELRSCREAECKLYSAPDPEVEPKVRAATEDVLARGGDLAELERLVEAKRRRERAKLMKIALIAVAAAVLLIVIVTSCSAISKRRYINAELAQARAAGEASRWSEVLDHTRNVLSKDANNTEAKELREEAWRREEARRQEEARRKAEEARRREDARRREEARRKAEERLKNLSTGDIVLELPGNVKLALVKVEAGTFTMGARDGENDSNEVPHRVTLTRDFYIGRTEVTTAQWKAVIGNDPSSRWFNDDLPVENVSWHDAMEFCKKLNEMGKAPDGWKFTLPTEAQWEYACRGGNRSRGCKYSGSNDLGEVAWYERNSGGKTHPVATKGANELGLYDMSGNVFEWCLDRYGSYGGDATDPTGPSDGSGRVFRGGGWSSWLPSARYCRSASRDGYDPGIRRNDLGFRLALVPVR